MKRIEKENAAEYRSFRSGNGLYGLFPRIRTDPAGKKNATPAQISLAWMLHKYPNVVPIPGSKNKERIIENLDSANVELKDEEFTALEDALNGMKVYGHRGLGGF